MDLIAPESRRKQSPGSPVPQPVRVAITGINLIERRPVYRRRSIAALQDR
jgi:hypothetical protein